MPTINFNTILVAAEAVILKHEFEIMAEQMRARPLIKFQAMINLAELAAFQINSLDRLREVKEFGFERIRRREQLQKVISVLSEAQRKLLN